MDLIIFVCNPSTFQSDFPSLFPKRHCAQHYACMAPGPSRSCVLPLPHSSMPVCSAVLQNPELQLGAVPLSYQTPSSSFSYGFPSYLDALCGCTAAVLSCLDICSHLNPDYLCSSLLILQHSAPTFLPVSSPTGGTLQAALSCTELGNLLCAQLPGREGTVWSVPFTEQVPCCWRSQKDQSSSEQCSSKVD